MLPSPSTAAQRSRPQPIQFLSEARSSLGQAFQVEEKDVEEGIVGIVRRFMPSPKTAAFILSCLMWYFASALSSNTSKALLSSQKKASPPIPAPFPYPVTLTLIQFVFIHILSASVASPTIMRHVPGMRKPVTRIVSNPGWKRISDMAKLSVFNVVGHALSTVAISRVPVSTVHTIKALTPLFTVLSFRYVFGVQYSFMAYFSLVPLTLGVMMACTSLSFSANDLVGLITALASTLIFVAQSIYSKNLVGRGSDKNVPADSKDAKLDKINILYYTSACSIGIMIPMALYYDGAKMFFGEESIGIKASSSYVFSMITANGIVQFAQNFLAFSVLALVSPVTYSIASLFKRVFVICFAIVWFGQSVSSLQWIGIVLTFVGLYIYNDAKSSKSIAKAEEKMELDERRKEMVLPTTARGAAWLSTANDAKQHTQSTSISIHGQSNPIHSSPSHHVSFLHDPRRSIPSPPPSRGPSSDDESGEISGRLKDTSK
jgi:solute carrier family 35, member E1